MLGDEDACGYCCSYGEEVEVGSGHRRHADFGVVISARRWPFTMTATVTVASSGLRLPRRARIHPGILMPPPRALPASPFEAA